MRLLLWSLVLTGCATVEPGFQRFEEVEYPFQSRVIRGRRAQVDLAMAELGEGPGVPVVLIHPWGFSMKVWSDVAPTLAKDRRVVLLDLPGHGKSEKLAAYYPMERLAAAVLDVMEAAGLENAVLIGNSLGGATALTTTLVEPARVKGLVLIGAPGGKKVPEPIRRAARQLATPQELHSLSDLGWATGFWMVGAAGTPLGMALSQDLRRLRTAYEHQAWSRATIASLRSVAEWAPDLSRIKAPTTVIHGAWDMVVWRSSSLAMAQQIPGARFVGLEDCGHMIEVECPGQLLEQIAISLAPLEAAGRPGAE
jgi:3-oxoadipate enol-lactonase